MPMLDALALSLQRSPDSPLYRQIVNGVAAGISAGTIRPGERLPSTRDLAHVLGVSRNTIMQAFEHLNAEGYLEGQIGSGTYVSRQPPNEEQPATLPQINPQLLAAGSIDHGCHVAEGLSHAPRTLRYMRRPVTFRANFPAIDAFPLQLWAKLTAELYRTFDTETANHLMGEGDPQGFHPLREEIAKHLADSRGIFTSADRIVVFAGAQQALDLACRLLLMPGDEIICEDPGYDGAYASAIAAGAVPAACAVDQAGLDVGAAIAKAPRARLAYVTPSKQFPIGVTLSMERRTALLDWAKRCGAFIIEDDYDSEFRYAGRALPSLFGLDGGRQVIYLGTFSKMLFPGLRLGYAVLPAPLVEPFVSARTIVGRYCPIHEQALVTRFMQAGHLSRHIRRMRKLYTERQDHLLDCIARDLSGYMSASATDTGMEVVARLSPGISARELAIAAGSAGIEIMPLSNLAHEAEVDDRINLGFSAFCAADMNAGTRSLRHILEKRWG